MTGVFRVGRSDRPVFSSPDHGHSGHGRFDAPARTIADTASSSYPVVYCCSSLHGAFIETLQKFRPSLGIVAQLGPDAGGSVPQAWANRRSWSQAAIGSDVIFVDSASSETLASLRSQRHLAVMADELGLPDIDLSALTGPHRRLTQAVSLHIHTSIPEAAGVRFVSRFGSDRNFECWAVFADRVRLDPGNPDRPVLVDLPEFRLALGTLGLSLLGDPMT